MALHAERDRLGRAVGSLPQRPRCDDAAVEDRRFQGGLFFVVEQLEGQHRRTERVLQHLAGRFRCEARAVRGVAVPVDRTVLVRIRAVVLAQLGPGVVDLGRLVERGRLQLEQRLHLVAEAQKLPQLGGVLLRHLQRCELPVLDCGEALAVDDERSFPQVLVGRAARRGNRGRRLDAPTHQLAMFGCVDDDAVDGLPETRRHRVEVGGDVEGRTAVHPLASVHVAQDVLRACVEVAVDVDRLAVDAAGGDGLPCVVTRRDVRLSSTEDQQVSDDLRPRSALVRAGRQTDRADQVGELVHLAPRARVAGVKSE